MATATVTEPPPIGAMYPLPFAVARNERETADTCTLTLEPLNGEGPVIAPGQFMMVYVLGVGEVPISVSGPAFAAGAVVLTVRAVGAVSAAICASQPGATLGLRGPFGTAWPIDAARGGDVVVVAGGIGLAPLRSTVLHTLAHSGRVRRRQPPLRREDAERPALHRSARGMAAADPGRRHRRRGRRRLARQGRRRAEARRRCAVPAGAT